MLLHPFLILYSPHHPGPIPFAIILVTYSAGSIIVKRKFHMRQTALLNPSSNILAMGPWTSLSTFRSIHFLIYKMELIISTHRAVKITYTK